MRKKAMIHTIYDLLVLLQLLLGKQGRLVLLPFSLAVTCTWNCDWIMYYWMIYREGKLLI